MPVTLTAKEDEELLREIRTSPGIAAGALSPEEDAELLAELQAGTVTSQGVPPPAAEGRARGTLGDTVEGIIGAGRKVAGAIASPRVAIPAAAGLTLGPGAAVAATPFAVLAEEAIDIAKAPRTETERNIDTFIKTAAPGPGGLSIRAGLAIGRGLDEMTDEDKLPAPNDLELDLMRDGFTGTALSSRFARGKGSEIAWRVVKNSTIDAALEATALWTIRSVNRARKGGFFKPSAEALEAQRILEPIGGRLSLPQLSDNAFTEYADKIARNGIKSGDVMKTFDAVSEANPRRAIEALNSEFMDKWGRNMTREELGSFLQSGFDIGTAGSKALERSLYSTAYREAEKMGIQISRKPIAGAIDDTIRGLKGKPLPTEDARNFVRQIQAMRKEMPANLSFREAAEWRSHMSTISFESQDKFTRKLAGGIAKNIENEMEVAAKASDNPILFRNWKRAKKFFSVSKDVFEDDFVSKLFIENKKSAQAIGEFIYKKGNVQEIKKVQRWIKVAEKRNKIARSRGLKDARGREIPTFDADEFTNSLRESYNRQLINKHFTFDQTSTVPGIGTSDRGFFNWNSFLNDLKNTKTRETFTTLFGGQHYARMLELAEAGQFQAATTRGAAGAWALMQMGALAGVPRAAAQSISGAGAGTFGKAVFSLASIVKIPEGMARMMTNESWIKWFTQGVKGMSEGTQAGIREGVVSMARMLESFADTMKKGKRNFFDFEFTEDELKRSNFQRVEQPQARKLSREAPQ